MREDLRVDAFTSFVEETEPRLRRALTATFGPDAGREATAEALAYAWRNWNRVRSLGNPAGYLYRVGRDKGRDYVRSLSGVGLEMPANPVPWIEPGLPTALAKLSDRQRTVVALIHGYQWTLAEVAELLGISKGSVQSHERRAMSRLRRQLGVPR